ncbi:MAG: antitoxin [Candidatus Dormibacteraeota bacterium]|uniref:Antitoxin n=1 Tax=Candidatus Amunia macphersoniae TaxID=3127014 RepID=A0A934KG87_9BACT|nr:antitoxin [Candidatus Dormibacteraeota bacterium]
MKLSVSLDDLLVRDVDAYVEAHAGLDRSKVVDEALRLWSAAQQRAAMELQFADADDVPADEHAAWRQTRREAARRRVART